MQLWNKNKIILIFQEKEDEGEEKECLKENFLWEKSINDKVRDDVKEEFKVTTYNNNNKQILYFTSYTKINSW